MVLTMIWGCHWFHNWLQPFRQTASRVCFEIQQLQKRCLHLHASQTWKVRSALRCCEKLHSCTSCRTGCRTVGLGPLIVSSVLAKSAGCDSRPLSWYLLTTGLGILSSHLPYHRLHHYHYLSLHSHLNVFAAGMRISASVSKKRCKLTTTDCRLSSVGSGCWLRFVSFW